MAGVEGWEFVPDIYAELNTIHGVFQIAANFVCQDPPSTSRVSFVLESVEAFAKKREPEFSEKDIFMVITPFRFSATASAAITKEDKDHSYYVVKVEASDLSRLLQAGNMQVKLAISQDIVKEAYGTVTCTRFLWTRDCDNLVQGDDHEEQGRGSNRPCDG